MRTLMNSESSKARETIAGPGKLNAQSRGGGTVQGPSLLRQQRFVPYFQPLVELRTGRIAGVEMLARCQHTTQGLLLPDSFIHQVEREGWLGDLLLDLTAEAALELQAIPSPVSLSINLSPLQLRDPRLPEQVRLIAASMGYPLRCLTLEITETAIAIDEPDCLEAARALKAMGCRLSLDDFGTGYSCLLHLQALPFDEVKIDRRFVSSMLEQRESRKIVSAVIGLGQSLGLRTVAEGVETEEQSAMLRWLGCDIGQGWLFGRPGPASSLSNVLKRPPLGSAGVRHLPAPDGSLDSPATRLAQLHAIYDSVPIGLAFLDTNLRYLNLNQRMADINHCTVEEHLGRTVSDLLPSLFPLLDPYLQRALQGEVIHDVELLIKPAQGPCYVRCFSYQPAWDQTGEVIGLCIAVSNRPLPKCDDLPVLTTS